MYYNKNKIMFCWIANNLYADCSGMQLFFNESQPTGVETLLTVAHSLINMRFQRPAENVCKVFI